MNGSVLKINHTREALPDAPPCGYRTLWLAREGMPAPRERVDPDGNRVKLWEPVNDVYEKMIGDAKTP